jgi:hypothetical protein
MHTRVSLRVEALLIGAANSGSSEICRTPIKSFEAKLNLQHLSASHGDTDLASFHRLPLLS